MCPDAYGRLKIVKHLGFIERFSIECRKTKTMLSQRPIRTTVSITRIQSELKVNTCNRPKARENAGDQVEIGFSFASDWLRR